MKRTMIAAALALTLTSGAALAADVNADQDTTPVTQCEGLPPSVSIPTMSWSDTTKVCGEMLSVLQGIRRKDITSFEKTITVLQHFDYEGGYAAGKTQQIASELVEIIRLRGLYDKPDRWEDNNDLVLKSWVVIPKDWSGRDGTFKPHPLDKIIGPRQIIDFLKGAGPMAKHVPHYIHVSKTA